MILSELKNRVGFFFFLSFDAARLPFLNNFLLRLIVDFQRYVLCPFL